MTIDIDHAAGALAYCFHKASGIGLTPGEAAALGAVRTEFDARALDLATVITMLTQCEAALRQMADDTAPSKRPIYDAAEQAHKAIRLARRDLEQMHVRQTAGTPGIVDPMTGRQI